MAILDIPSTFIQAVMDEKVHVRLDVNKAKLIENIKPQVYCKCIKIQNGKNIIYAQCHLMV